MELMRWYRILRNHFGFLNWWPGETKLEICIGAILTQSTAWKNVEKAIDNLKKEGLLDVLALHRVEEKTLAQLIRSALYYNQKAKKIKIFIEYFLEQYNGSFEKMAQKEAGALREELLSLWGIGPETADSIILYALEKPVFVIDAYTRRVLLRHGYENADKVSYDELQEYFEKNLPKDVELYKDFHAQFVELGKNYCRKKPLCSGCPLNRFFNKTTSRLYKVE